MCFSLKQYSILIHFFLIFKENNTYICLLEIKMKWNNPNKRVFETLLFKPELNNRNKRNKNRITLQSMNNEEKIETNNLFSLCRKIIQNEFKVKVKKVEIISNVKESKLNFHMKCYHHSQNLNRCKSKWQIKLNLIENRLEFFNNHQCEVKK
jgi:hypothetical protein